QFPVAAPISLHIAARHDHRLLQGLLDPSQQTAIGTNESGKRQGDNQEGKAYPEGFPLARRGRFVHWLTSNCQGMMVPIRLIAIDRLTLSCAVALILICICSERGVIVDSAMSSFPPAIWSRGNSNTIKIGRGIPGSSRSEPTMPGASVGRLLMA